MVPNRGTACAEVISAHAPEDLAMRYRIGLETQVNIRQGEQKTSGAYNYRIADLTSAEKPQTFDLATHYDSIGISGHDPVNGVSIGVGFDFDSVVGHKAGLSNDRLDVMRDAVMRQNYIEVRRSTGGAGYHLWVWFDPENLPKTANRAEHKALARAVLHKMCVDTGHDLAADVDCCGAMLWICAVRATPENLGLTLLKPAETPLTDYPANWREHLEVVKGNRKKTKAHPSLTDGDADVFDDAHQDRPRVPLGIEHQAMIDKLVAVGYPPVWNQDHNCLAAHTYGLKLIKKQYGLRGLFDTVSEGADPNHPNCFLFPLDGGAWRAFRFSPGTKECEIWETSPNGWTTCTVNETPTTERAALCCRGIRSPKKTVEAFLFRESADVQEMVEALGGTIKFPTFATGRQFSVRDREGSALIIEFEHEAADDVYLDDAWKLGWTKEQKAWATVVTIDSRSVIADKSPWMDRLVRHVSQDGQQVSLFSKTVQGWQRHTTDRVRDFLIHKGFHPMFIGGHLGWCAANPWDLVSIPFSPEYPGNRRWNRKGSKLLYEPSSFPGETPCWDMILAHLGGGLSEAVEADDWCKAHNILTGADYLSWWAAIMIRTPERRLPMVFFYSKPEQNTGKSAFHEALGTLFDENGFTFADKPLTLASGFNSELRGKVLCAVEETNIAQSDLAYTRLKSWITSPQIAIYGKGVDGFTDVNYTHWIMTANDPAFLPLEGGDTRIVISEVPPYEGEDVPKDVLLNRIRKENPQFLNRLYSYDISDSAGRHTLPVLVTPEKLARVKSMETYTKFDGLEGVPRKLCEGLIALPKPFSGPASALDAALGAGWIGDAGKPNQRGRETAIGRHMKRLMPTLAKEGITLSIQTGRHSIYHISA